ncbi:MAG: nitroreductase family deazaflavin-dependent oxidoreductase [Dehalococcoidia bacterium]|nr:nitroreductase family deazaflavin-dependent oxidoreductase [Dehalococcoidia bacterium]
MQNPVNRNQALIDEFRANSGKVTGRHERSTLLLLTTMGAKTGRSHTTPVGYMPDGSRFLIFASKGGGPTNPDWYHNLLANPIATVEVGEEAFMARAVVLNGEERDRLYARQVERSPAFDEYELKTKRKIPVVALERIT